MNSKSTINRPAPVKFYLKNQSVKTLNRLTDLKGNRVYSDVLNDQSYSQDKTALDADDSDGGFGIEQ